MAVNAVNRESGSDYCGFWVRDSDFYGHLFALAVPIVFQNLITFGVTFSDNLMIGRLGDAAISGLYMGSLIQTILQIMIAGVESAILILSAQYWGRRDCERIKDIVSIGTRIALAGTLMVTLASCLFPEKIIHALTPDSGAIREGSAYLGIVGISYLFFCVSQMLIIAMRSVEVVKIGLINSIVAFCVNVFLNYVLIFGKLGMPALGVRGAALATVISRVVEFSVVLFFVLRFDRRLQLKLPDFFRWDRDIFHDLCRYGTPLLLGQGTWAVNNIVQSAVIGQLRATAITAASVTGMLDRLLWMGVWGVAAATGIMVGKAIGAGEYAKVRQYARTMQVVFLGFGFVSALLVYFGHGIFLSFYKLTPESYRMTEQFMLVLAVAIIGRCYQAPSLFGLVKAGGDTSFVFKNDTFWVFCWIIPGALLALHLRAPAWAVWAILLSDQITKCFVAVIKINSFNWIRNLTRDPALPEAAAGTGDGT